MATPDLIVPLAGDTQAWVWAEAVEITRQGSRPVPGLDGVTDKWRIGIPVAASLAQNNQALLDANGAEVHIPVPPGVVKCAGCDIADIIHDAEVQQCLALVKSITMRLMSGALVPTPIPQEAP